jgi:hypothetical protein
MEQADGTSWMGTYCLNMLAMALELARENPAYEDVASKFFEHFVRIAHAMNHLGGDGVALWDEEDGFYYDVLHVPGEPSQHLKVRSMVGLVPLFAVETLEPDVVDALPGFKRRMKWFIEHDPEFAHHVDVTQRSERGLRRLLTLVSREQLLRVLGYALSQAEFLSPYGIRSLSRVHAERPFVFHLGGVEHRVDYDPGESTTGMFGGNSNWRGPVWFPMNFLLIESLQKFHHYFGESLQVEYPAGSGKRKDLWDVSLDLERRLAQIFLRGPDGRRPVFSRAEKFQTDPHWRDLILFHEYFHGDTGCGLGASHQTGWTALVAKLIEQSGG